MNSPKVFKFAANTHGIDKNWNWDALATGYQDREGTITDVIDRVKSGHALCAGLLGGQRRSKANVIGSEWVLLDIDNSAIQKDADGQPVKDADGKAIKIYQHDLTLEEAIAHPFVQKHCALIYTTASHKPDWHKFRLVFLLPQYVEGSEAVEAMVRLLMEQFPHDPSCKDASRVFFGSTQATFPLVNPDACLPADWLARALTLAEETKAANGQRLVLVERKREQFAKLAADEGWDTAALAIEALGYIPPRTQGSGTYDESRQVLMALTDYFGAAEAERLAERWSPSIKGTTWNVGQKIRSFRRSGISIGTLFHIAQQYGFRFPERQSRSQPKQAPQPDQKEQTQRKTKAEQFQDEVAEKQKWLNRLDLEPTLKVTDRYLPFGQLPEQPGIVLVDAPMGTGKTASYCKGLLDHQAAIAPAGKFIMLGARNLLQFQTMKEYGGKHHSEYSSCGEMLGDRWWVGCFDSIHKFNPERITEGSILFLDEISGGFKHLIVGSTLKETRPFAYRRFREVCRTVVKKGGWIVGAVDNLTNVELGILLDLVGADVPVTLTQSKWQGEPWEITIYDSPSLTWEEIRDHYDEGGMSDKGWKPLIMASDSAKKLRETERFLVEEVGLPKERVWILDADSSPEPWAKAFANDPDKWIATHKPLFLGYSPTLESGVSITAKNADGTPYFEAMAFHLVGTLEPRDTIQLPARYRLPVPRFGYVKEFAIKDEGCRSQHPDVILRDLRKTADGIAKYTQIAEFVAKEQAASTGDNEPDLAGTLSRLLNAGDDAGEDTLCLKHFSWITARENGGKARLRADIIERWEAKGHHVTVKQLGANKSLGDTCGRIRKTLDTEESTKFAQADISALTVDEARDILERFGSTKDQRRGAKKRLLAERLPGCPLDTVEFVQKTIVSDNGKFLKTAELLWSYQHPDWQQQIDRLSFFGKIKRAANRGEWVYAADLRSRGYQAALMARSPLEACLNDEWYGDDAPQVIKFKEWALWSRFEIKRVLRLTVHKDQSATAILNKFLRKLGYEMEDKRPGKRGEDRPRIYRINNLEDCDRDAILTALTAKFQASQPSVSNICTVQTPLQNLDTAEAESAPDDDWTSPASLDNVRQMWFNAGNDEARASLEAVIPGRVLELAGIYEFDSHSGGLLVHF